MSRNSPAALSEGQVFAQHKVIRRRSSVPFAPPFKRPQDDVGEEEEERDEDVFEESVAGNETFGRDRSLSDGGSSRGSAEGDANVTNPFLERLKKDPRYSPSAIRRRQSSDCVSASPSADKRPSSSARGSPKCETPLRLGRGSSSLATSPKKGSSVTQSRSSSATPKLKSMTTPKLGAMSPMAVKAINNQMRSESVGVGSFEKNRSRLISAFHHLSSSSASPGRVLLPNKNLLNRASTASSGKDRGSSAASSRRCSSSSAGEDHPSPLSPTPSLKRASRRSDSMELTSCSPNLVRTSVSTSDESLLATGAKGTPSNGESDMELVETTPSSLPKIPRFIHVTEEHANILNGIHFYVEVYGRDDQSNRSAAIEDQIERMGGTCHSRLDADVTHVVFRDGRGATYEKALKKGLHLVNVLWLEYCKWHKVKVLEKDYRAKPPPVIEKPDPFGLGLNKGAKRYARKPRSMNNLLDSESRSAERVKRRKKRLERKEKLKELISPPKKKLFDENGEELPTLSQILASETPQPLLQGFVSETPWPPKRPIGGRDAGASPRLKSNGDADEDGDDETSAVIRSAEKRNQKVKDLLRRMQSSDEEDFLCEPLTQAMAPLHVRLNLHQSVEKGQRHRSTGGRIPSCDGDGRENVPLRVDSLPKTPTATTPLKGVTFRPELSIVPNSPSFHGDNSTAGALTSPCGVSAAAAAATSPQLDVSKVKAATKVPSTLKAWLDEDGDEEIALTDDDDGEREKEVESVKVSAVGESKESAKGEEERIVGTAAEKESSRLVDDEEDRLAIEREDETSKSRPNIVIPETQNFLGDDDWVRKSVENVEGEKGESATGDELERTKMFDEVKISDVASRAESGLPSESAVACSQRPPPTASVAAGAENPAVPQASPSASASSARIRRRSRASCRFDAPLLAPPVTPKTRKTFLDFVNAKRKTPQKTATPLKGKTTTTPGMTITTPGVAPEPPAEKMGEFASSSTVETSSMDDTIPRSSFTASGGQVAPAPSLEKSSKSSRNLDKPTVSTSPPIARFFSRCKRKSSKDATDDAIAETTVGRNLSQTRELNRAGSKTNSKRRSKPLATSRKSISPSTNKAITEYFSQTSSGKAVETTDRSAPVADIDAEDEEEESVIDSTVKSPTIVERLLMKAQNGSESNPSASNVTSLDRASSRKRLSSEVDDNDADDDSETDNDGKRRKTTISTLPTISGTPPNEVPTDPKTPLNIPRRKKLFAMKEFSTPPEALLSPSTGRDLSPSVVVGLKKRGKPVGRGDRRRSARIARTDSQSSLEKDDSTIDGRERRSEMVRPEMTVKPVNSALDKVDGRRNDARPKNSSSDMAVVFRRKSIAKKTALSDSDAYLSGHSRSLATQMVTSPFDKLIEAVTDVSAAAVRGAKAANVDEALTAEDANVDEAFTLRDVNPDKDGNVDKALNAKDTSAHEANEDTSRPKDVSAESMVSVNPVADILACADGPVNSPRIVRRKSVAPGRGGIRREREVDSVSDGSASSGATNEDVLSLPGPVSARIKPLPSQKRATKKSKANAPTSNADTDDEDAASSAIAPSTDDASKASQPRNGDPDLNTATTRNSLEDFCLKPRKKKDAAASASNLGSRKSKAITNAKSSSSSSSSSDERCGRLAVGATKRSSKARLPGLMMTSCHRHQQDRVKAALKSLPERFHHASSFARAVTHVVSGEPRRTLNLLRGIVAGCWVVSFEWVVESVAAGRWLEEESYECAEDFPTCQITRQNPELTKALFEGNDGEPAFSRILVDKECFPPRGELTALIEGCGGALTNCLRNADVVVTSKSSVAKSRKGVVVVNPTWVLDSITNFQRMPFQEYLITQDDSSSEDGMSQEY